jgi:hypothetical protein
VSSETPPSIPPRPKSGTSGTGSTKTGSTPTVSPSGSGSGTSTARTSTARTSTTSTPARTSSAPATAKGSTSTPAPEKPKTAAAAAAPSVSTPAASTATATAERPATQQPAAKQPAAASTGPRRVRLAISRVDPWSVMKLSFLISVAVGIMLVVATFVVWLTLDGLHVFSSINDLVTEVLADSNIDLMQYVALNRVVSVATLIAVVDVFLITALATIGAFLYNITAALVGGVHVTMTDD